MKTSLKISDDAKSSFRVQERMAGGWRGMQKGDANRRGLTLVEVMMAMLILAAIAMVVPAALRHPRAMVVHAAQRQLAVDAATVVLERAVSTDYANLTVGEHNLTDLDQNRLNGVALKGTRSVSLVSGTGGDPEYKHVIVSVSYSGDPAPVLLETRVYGN